MMVRYLSYFNNKVTQYCSVVISLSSLPSCFCVDIYWVLELNAVLRGSWWFTTLITYYCGVNPLTPTVATWVQP